MRNIYPSMVPLDSRYTLELKRLQDNFLAGITESPEETAYRNSCHKAWVKSTAPKREVDTHS